MQPRKNINEITIVLTEAGLNRFKVTPVFKNLLSENQLADLKPGENILYVNQTVLGALKSLTDRHLQIKS